jgi:hypothetical protein
MFHSRSPQSHHLRRGPLLHTLEGCFMQMPGYEPLWPPPLPDAAAGTRQSSCDLASAVPAATSTRHCPGTPPPASARNGFAADTRTGTASANPADHNPAARSPLGALESQLRPIQPLHKRIDHPADMIVGDQLLQRDRNKLPCVRPSPCTKPIKNAPASARASSHFLTLRPLT